MSAAIESSNSGSSFQGTTMVSATALAGTPADPDIPWLATPLPPAARRLSAWPW